MRSPCSSSASSPTVALFADRFLPYSQTFIYDEIRAHNRYTVDVFCKERLNEDRFPYDRYVEPRSRLATRLYENLGYWPRFDRILAEGRHDLIHAHFGTTAVYALPYVLRHDLPFVITFWGNDVSVLLGSQRFNPKNWRYLWLQNTLMEHADLMLGVSKELCAFVRELSDRPDAVQWYRHGIDLDRFHPVPHENDIPQILMVGRFTEKKGHRYALRAFAQVIEAGRSAHLTLVGDGERESACRQFVRDRGLDPHVTFAGVLPHTEVADRLSQADIALLPSVVARNHDREGSPTVAKEAAACGIPLVGTYHGGLPEIVEDGTTGYLVPERTADALADRLLTLIDNPEQRRSFGEAARDKMATEYDLFDQVQTLEQHYDRICR